MNQKAYRLRTGYELTKPADYPAGSVFTISDLHLDHENIISYCNRPFHNTAEMNRVLINNWNYVVKPTDIVFYVGDMSFGKADKFIRKLHGNIIFISGNHDEIDDIDRIQEYAYLSYKDITFLFVHDPWMKPAEFQGWTIHGHHHNNNPAKYPFFDPDKKKINVSVEMIRYHPYPMDCIVNMIKENHERIVTG